MSRRRPALRLANEPDLRGRALQLPRTHLPHLQTVITRRSLHPAHQGFPRSNSQHLPQSGRKQRHQHSWRLPEDNGKDQEGTDGAGSEGNHGAFWAVQGIVAKDWGVLPFTAQERAHPSTARLIFSQASIRNCPTSSISCWQTTTTASSTCSRSSRSTVSCLGTKTASWCSVISPNS